MKKTRIGARAIWILTLAQSTVAGASPPAPGAFFPLHGLQAMPLMLLPLVFFVVAAFLMKGYPFDAPPLRKSVDDRFGEGVYADFIFELKPLLMFAVNGIYSGFLMLYVTRHAPSAAAHGLAAFMISSGAGFWLLRAILAKRGLSLESSRAESPWASREFAPQAIRRIHATKRTAFVAGGWTALGMSTAEAVEKAYHLDPNTGNLVFFLMAIPFFFLPVGIFVFGYQNELAAMEGESQWKRQNRRMAGAMVRGFCWMGGAFVFMIVWTVVLAVFWQG